MSTNYNKKSELYSGKAKTVYTTDDEDKLILHFRDDTSAFDGKKVAQLSGKGQLNNLFNAHIMQRLEQDNIPTAFIKLLSNQESLVKNLTMLPVECVVRNYTAGSICRRYNLESHQKLSPALFEFFLKNDELGDPLIVDQHITNFGWATQEDIDHMRQYSLEVNKVLSQFFDERGLILVDFKLEFGKQDNKLYLGDEFTPDGCRIWDKNTHEVYDKDRFRKDMGDVISGYSMAAEKLGIDLTANL